MNTGSKVKREADEPLQDDAAALTLPANVDSVPSFSSVVETRTASGQRHLGRAEFDGGPAIGDDVAGHYRVLGVLGEGGMGRVYECENHRTGRRVALKWVPAVQAGGADAIARFAREARVAGHVEHPNVIDVYDVVEEGPATFLVMELLTGESLAELLETTPQLPVQVAVDIAIEATRGIAAAHAAGVVHRDLKPDNLFLCEGKGVRVKVVDFGVSKRFGAEAEMSLTQTGAVVGTPYYMAPEQMRGRRDLDHRLDVYAMGAIVYEMLAGVQPYRAETLGALAIKVATEDPVALSSYRSDLPEGLEAVIRRAMERDREQRFDDIEQLALALEPFGRLPFASDRPGSYSGGVRFDISSSKLALPDRGSRDNLPTVAAKAATTTTSRSPWLVPLLALAALFALVLAWVSLSASPEVSDTTTPPPQANDPAPEFDTPPTAVTEPEPPPEAQAEAPPAIVEPPAAATDAGSAATRAPTRRSSMRASRMRSSTAMRPETREESAMTAVTETVPSPMAVSPMAVSPMAVTHRAGELGVDDF